MGRKAEAGYLRHAGRAGTEVKSKVQSPKSKVGELAFIALGSNLGDSRQTILKGMERLQEFSDRPVLKSSLWETAPVDCPPGSPVFVNAVAGLQPRGRETPESLLAKLRKIEREFGRQPKKTLNEPRPLDLDLIAFGNQTRDSQRLTLPHPRAHLRRFVLQPLDELAPKLILPGQTKTVSALLRELPSGEIIRKLG
jgi:2-amino-4-hydroxy-6-hydroxymethyldihydropteridine diphosphokinase